MIPSPEQFLRFGWAVATYPELAFLGRALLIWFVLSCVVQAALALVLRPSWYTIPTLLVPLAGCLFLFYKRCPEGSVDCIDNDLGHVLATLVILWAAVAWIGASMLGFFVAKPLYRKLRAT